MRQGEGLIYPEIPGKFEDADAADHLITWLTLL